jgi:enamine deaminase RidA (YjgF/YER057c/UK114 family)
MGCAVLALCACGGEGDDTGSSGPKGPSSSLFLVPSSLDDLAAEAWFDHPWPSDFRRDPDGAVHITGYYNPRSVVLIKTYLTAMAKAIDGFSPVAAGYLRFTGPIEPATLPANPSEATSSDASVQLIDVDEASPERGQRKRVTLHWRLEEGAWWRPYTLAFMPTMGFPLRPSTRYALVVTNDVTASDSSRIGVAPELRQVLGIDAAAGATQGLRDRWAPAVTALEQAGVDRARIVHLTVFTTSDPTKEAMLFADHARSRQPAPTVDDAWELKEQTTEYDVYEGSFGPSPDYQRGEPPFEYVGGGFEVDAQGVPVVQREFHARFALAVPKASSCPMPADGYPVVMYAHGTGGDYRSVLGATGKSLALRCMAAMGVDQIMHPGRLPEGKWVPELLFFNVQNPDAMRTNIRQSAIDEVVRARLIRESGIDVPASVSATGAAIRMARSPVVFFGHSQGGLNGPLFLAVDDGARGGVLSGSGSMTTITLMEKTKPDPNIAVLTKTLLLALSPEEYPELNRLHPGLSLVQTMGDPVDPIHYVPMMVQRPRPGFAPKSIYQTEGVNPDFTGDNYTPPYAIEVQAIATGLPWMKPVIHTVPEASYAGVPAVGIPSDGLSGNLPGGKASGVLAQWPASEASDGHFVVSQIPAARDQAAQFCRNLFDDPVGRIPAP